MITLTIPADLEGVLAQAARHYGVAVEWLGDLQQRLCQNGRVARPCARWTPPVPDLPVYSFQEIALALEALRERFAPETRPAPGNATLFDGLGDGIGAVAGSNEAWSERCGERFVEGLSAERRPG